MRAGLHILAMKLSGQSWMPTDEKGAAMKAFHLGDVLSITTGRLVSPDHIDGIYRILNYMTGDNLFTSATRKENAVTKEEAVREELKHGKEEGMLGDLCRLMPNLSLRWVEAVADGAPLDDAQVDVLWGALNLDDSALEDEPDPNAPSEHEGVRSWVIETVAGVEGPSISLSPSNEPYSWGTRIAGPKPWGGGRTTHIWKIDPERIFDGLGFKRDEARELAQKVEQIRKASEKRMAGIHAEFAAKGTQ